jgi:HAD superfamily hydrolase (TIGR01484 family)
VTPGPRTPAPISGLPPAFCRRLRYLFTDIDDTITTDGLLPAEAYHALWDLSRAGINVVPVTGRPAGWCDHIARMWPAAAVVGENGAFYYSYDRVARRMARRYFGAAAGGSPAPVLRRIAERVLREVPGTALAADQPFRVSDMAIDFCEDVPPLGTDAVDAICAILAAEGVTCRVSSIHVNFWQGGFDKMSGVKAWLDDAAGPGGAEAALPSSIFIGDSPNDEPLFAGFPVSAAVANLARWLPRLGSLPTYLTTAESAAGFCEAARVILARRGA